MEEFNGESGVELSATYADIGNGVSVVEFEGGIQCSIGRPAELDAIAEKLKPYALEPAFLTTVLDDEEIRLYVGPPGMEDEAKSDDALEEIKGLLQHLSVNGKAKLKALLEG